MKVAAVWYAKNVEYITDPSEGKKYSNTFAN